MEGSSGGVHLRALRAGVDAVLALVDASTRSESPPAPPTPRQAPGSALETICACFGLSDFERDVLLLAAAAELEPASGRRMAEAGPGLAYPTFSLALATLPEPHWSALTPVAPLRRFRLVEPDDEAGGVLTARIRLDERVLHFLAGVAHPDERLGGYFRPCAPPADLPPSHRRPAERLAAGWAADLVGSDGRARRDLAALAAAKAGLTLYTGSAADLPAEPRERERLGRLWEREAVLLPAALLLEVADPAQAGVAEAFASAVGVPVVLSGDDVLPTVNRNRERLAVPALDADEQQELWADALGVADRNGEAGDELRALVAQFSLPPHVIRTAAARAREAAGDPLRNAWHAGLTYARIGLDELGHRIEPRASWDDLVVPEQQRAILRQIVAHVRQRGTVYRRWGFDVLLRRGLGVTALFAGPSGTGKTLAAEVIAGELGLDLFVIDLSQVVSKYIGETEKNLRRVFDAAERGGAVLLFDEADALFGKRSEVKDSHDRYANLEVSYLLMRMEAYRGLAVLTTNLKQALDQAFMRRIRFVVDFPFPTPPERAEIWQKVIPAEVPVKDLAFDRLAQLTVAGGSIRNIALSAAFLAADEESPLQMRHLLAASRTEYVKLERSLTPGEVAGWV